MRTFDTSEVKPEEIDSLGHMNVRFYMERARRANRLLLAELGLGGDEGEAPGVRAAQSDTYVRYLREQLQGQVLSVNGGVLAADELTVRAFYELTNPSRCEVAATFIIVNTLTDGMTGAAAPPPLAVRKATEPLLVELPDYGKPRTIELKPPRLDLSYAAVAARVPENTDPMSRRSQWAVPPETCDEHGNLADTGALMFGGWREPSRDEVRNDDWTFVGDEGHRLGWASLETRTVLAGAARVGDTLASIGAEVGLHAKVRHSRQWLFNLTSGRLVSVSDDVSIALDLDARRAIDIPPSARGLIEANFAPELA